MSIKVMTSYERLSLCLAPFKLSINELARKRLNKVARAYPGRPEILDVGGRRSPYTIGISADITITDLPRQTDIQQELGLGIDDEIVNRTLARRSNIRRMLLDDMTRSSLPDSSFDCVLAVEVLEHVEEDEMFVKEVHRVLRHGGSFLMTTPNGDFVENTNPDHKRHYTRKQLSDLLSSYFDEVSVEYAIQHGVFHDYGLHSWSIGRPWKTTRGMVSNLVNSIQSARTSLKEQSEGTLHLFALARKSG